MNERALLKQLADDITHQADIAIKVYRGGLSADINVEELRSQVNLIRGEQQVIEQNIVVSRNALQYLINHNPGNLKTTKRFADFNNKN